MKNVAKKSTSLKPACLQQNGSQAQPKGVMTSSAKHVENGVIELSEQDGIDDDVSILSDDKVAENQDGQPVRKTSLSVNDENSNDSLLEVSCVSIDDANNCKSQFNNDRCTPRPRSSSPLRIMASSTSRQPSDNQNGADVSHVSDDEVIVCERSSPKVGGQTGVTVSASHPGPAEKSATSKNNGPVCRVENCEIFENKPETDSEDLQLKLDNSSGELSEMDEKDVIEVITDDDVSTSKGTSAKRTSAKRFPSDSANETNPTKKSRLEVAESEVLTSCFSQCLIDGEKKVTISAKQLNSVVLSCIESYLTKSQGSVIKQLKAEIEELKASREYWKKVADQLRKDVQQVQTIQQRHERRRSSNSRVQKRSVACQVSRERKVSGAVAISPVRSLANGISFNSTCKAVMPPQPPNQPAMASGISLALVAPSILPPASANLAASQRLKWLHQPPPIRLASAGTQNGPLKQSSSTEDQPVRPQSMSTSTNSAVMIDLTAEEDIRTHKMAQLAQNNLMTAQPRNVVIAPNPNTYFVYAQETMPSGPVKTSGKNDGVMVSSGSLPTLSMNSTMAGGAYQSLPSLVSVGNRHSAPVLQVLKMRPPPPLQSAPIRQGPALPVLPTSTAVLRVAEAPPSVACHPAPLPVTSVAQAVVPGAKQVPPKPTLKLSRVAQGIVLSWNATINSYQEEPSSYQLFAYQQGTDSPSSTLWKKVGNVKALALPMACTLTQFQVGNKYHFAVRAVDQHGRIGPFSEPGSIHLEGGHAT